MNKRDRFQDWLSKGPILADGAMGTMLHDRGVDWNTCFDELNLTEPDRILALHTEYIEAGAQIIETNTYGANGFKLSAIGLQDKVIEINTAAVAIAREAVMGASHEVLIAGSVGPLGASLAPYGRMQPDQALCVYEDQISALAEAGVDLILIETQTDLEEVILAVKAAQSVSELPVIATMTFTRDDRTLLGNTPSEVAEALSASGADVIGVNCSGGPAQILRILSKMREAKPEAHFCVMPNAGWPERTDGRIIYSNNPQYFGNYAKAFKQAGASIIGGCCGTTPQHIAAARDALEDLHPTTQLIKPIQSSSLSGRTILSSQSPTQLATKIQDGQFVITVEMNPPHGFSTHKLLAGARMLVEAGADLINLPDSPMARMRMSPWAACRLIQSKVGVETILHFPTRGRNILRVQSDLLAAHALDVRNIFVVMGDPTSIGDYPEATDSYDVVPSGLIHLIQQGFNTGVDHAGSKLGDSTCFFVGCALNLAAKDLNREMRVFNRKIESGAHFALTQPIYDPEYLHQFKHEYRRLFGELNIPILIGILPLYSARHAEFLHHEVPGIQIPKKIRERILAAGNDAPEEGVRIAIDLLKQMKPDVQGAYIMSAFGHYDLVAEVIEAVREHPPMSDPC